ncbi:MAG TPA: cysteine desulfurase, partial [Cryomorphaceae bacterium]|nr:cysteine desulfurase [Cryomorphaceae bacterium]
DNAATTQKPEQVIEAIANYYRRDNGNVHRGVHALSDRATVAFEKARETVGRFIGSLASHQVIWTRGTTEAINLVAHSWGRDNLGPGDRVLVSWLEHHSNIVPWQMAAQRSGAKLIVAKVNDSGELDMDDFSAKISERTKLVSIVHVSNALGTINPIKEIIAAAKKVGALTLIDGAQSAPHMKIDVQDMGCDFYVLSGHKMYGPTGTGILFAREEVMEKMPPYQGGGEMIKTVTFEKTTYNELPFRYEAGTPNIAGAIGLAEAADFIDEIGIGEIERIEQTLLKHAHEKLSEIDGMRFIGTAKHKASVVSFLIDGTHPTDVGTIIDKLGYAVRTGHHCTQPLMAKFGIPGTLRASFSVYNTTEEIDGFAKAVARAAKMLK